MALPNGWRRPGKIHFAKLPAPALPIGSSATDPQMPSHLRVKSCASS
jgi:hypothetical protein